jgi:hypothetical protein
MGNQQGGGEAEVDPCHKLACKIQKCLQDSNYSQDKCKPDFIAYNECVKKYVETKQKEKLSQ